ncbi:MAG: lysozyme [Alphaproteobacteria bacterium]|nr:lysozyme [Alphaproteobacteria bacterium]
MSNAKTVIQGAGGALVIAAGLAGFLEGKTNHAIIPVPGDVPTICRGHTGPDVKLGMVASDQQCDEWFAADLSIAFKGIERQAPGVVMPATRRAAIASWFLNVGAGNAARSTLMRLLREGDQIGACNELTRWVYAGGRKLKGLVNRRSVERAVCLMEPEEEPFWRKYLPSV